MKIQVRKNSVAVLGFHEGLAGQTSEWFEKATGYHIACYVHEAAKPLIVDVAAENKKRVNRSFEYPKKESYRGKPLITSLSWEKEIEELGINKILPLTPDNLVRKKQIEKCKAKKFSLVSAIHPSVLILKKAEIAEGVWINAGAIIGFKTEISEGVLLNTGVSIDHHNVLKSCSQADPGVVTAGNVTFWECAHVHTGATVINRIQIGRNSVVGAGSVVVGDIPSDSLAYGVPAKVKRAI
jgi:serine O-acetyltransferase